MSGWLKLHRQLQDNPLWLSEPFSRGQAWVDLMMLANHKPSYIRVRGNRIDVGKGVVARSKDKLAERWQWSRGKVLRFISELEKDGQVVQETVHNFTLISLCNYETYQSRQDSRSTTDGTTDSTAVDTTDGRETVQQTVHIQEEKQQQEEKEGKKLKAPQAKPKFDPPLWMASDKWKAYLSTRRSKKRPMNAEALELTCEAIDKTVQAGYGLDDIMAALIGAGWQTVTPTYMDGWLKSQGRGQVSTHTDFDSRDYHNDPAAAKFKQSGAR